MGIWSHNPNYLTLAIPAAGHALRGAATTSAGFLLLEWILEAVVEPARWPGVLARLGSILGIARPTQCDVLRPKNSRRQDICPNCTHAMDRFKNWAAEADDGNPELNIVCQYIARAAAMCARMRALEDQRSASFEVLDRLGRGLLLVNSKGRIVVGNAVAWEILNEGDGLRSTFESIRASRPEENIMLREAIKKAVNAADAQQPFDAMLTISRPSLRRALNLVVAGKTPRNWCGEERNLASVFICDPERKMAMDPSALSGLYGLTKSEAALTIKLLQGETLETAADKLCISIETARTHVKRVFLKTSTNRQAQLVAMILKNRL